MNLTLYGSRILLALDEMTNKVGSFYIPDKHSERSRMATVLTVGDTVEHYVSGDKVLISWYTGVHLHLVGQTLFGVEVDEDRHRLVMESEILGKITE